MKRFVLTPAAEADLAEIIEFIRLDNPDAARRILARFHTAMERLAAMPGMGHPREDLADEPLRFWALYSYLIVYRPQTRPLQIIRVVHGARNVRRLLGLPQEYLETCRVCPIVNLCLWCPAHAHLETGELDGPVDYFCRVAHARAAALRASRP